MPLPERSNVPFGPNSDPSYINEAVSLQDLFSRFDKGIMSQQKFTEGLVAFGYEITPQLQRLMSASGESCSLSFTALMKALRKTGDEENSSTLNVTYKSTPRSVVSNNANERSQDVQRAVNAFLAGHINAEQLKEELGAHGVPWSIELDRVLRRHEQDHSRTFQGFAILLERYGINLSRKSHDSGSMRSLLGNPLAQHSSRTESKRDGVSSNFMTW